MKNDHFRLDQAVPPMPDEFLNRMNQTLKEIEDMKKHPKITFTLAAAIIAALILTTVAVAQVVESGILSRLFGEDAPSQKAAELLQMGVSSVESEGITLMVDELLFDGRNIYCDWTLESAREGAIFAMTDVRVTGGGDSAIEGENFRGMSASLDVNNNYLRMLGEKDGVAVPKTFNGEMEINYTEALTEEAALEFTVHVFESELVPVLAERLEFDAEDGAKMEENGQIRLAWGNVGTLENYPSYVEALQDEGEGDDWQERRAEAVAASGLMQPVAELGLSVPLVVRDGGAVSFGPESFELENCTLEVENVSFSPASMNIDLNLTNLSEELRDSFPKLIVAVDGEPLMKLSIEGGGEVDADGNAYEDMIITGAPLANVPEEITFILFDSAMTEDETVAEYYARMVREADSGNSAVMRLEKAK